MKIKIITNFLKFLKKDSWSSFFVELLIALFIIKLIIFPLLSLITGTTLPLVIVESCSMHHSQSLESIMENKIYSTYNLSYSNSSNWILKNGFNKGDIILVISAKNINIGDVLIFNAGQTNPIIHRIIYLDNISATTKGDNNVGFLPFERGIPKENFIGKAVFRIPAMGWIKLIFFDWMKPESQRGLC